MASNQHVARLLHCLRIQLDMRVVGSAAVLRGSAPYCNLIAVVAVVNGETGVKVSGNFLRVLDRNVKRKAVVKGSHPMRVRHRIGGIEVNHLSPRVRTAVGPACSGDLGFVPRDKAYGIFQCTVDRSLVRLCGPAAEVCAVVFDDEFDSSS